MTVSLAVLGAGMMGGAIALDAARHGLDVTVYDTRPDFFPKHVDRARGVYARWVKQGRMTQEAADAAIARMKPTESLADAAKADVVIEAVFENLDIKRALFAEIVPLLGAETILATNTSALRVQDIAQGLAHRDRILGLHYFSPAEVSPLVEVVRTAETSEDTLARARVFLTATKRTALACDDTPGFAINRFFCPYYNEATRIAEDGLATPSEIDRVATERLKIAAGPFKVMNLIGLAVSAHAEEYLAPLGPFYAVSPTLAEHGETGARWVLDETVEMPAAADVIADRLVAALAVPALELAAQTHDDPDAVDNGAHLALRFGQGPYELMRAWPADRFEKALKEMCARYGHPLPPRLAMAA